MDIHLLISAVFGKKQLWDQRNPMHHNRFVLDKLWDKVAEEVGTTRKVVRAKWKIMRDKFRIEFQKKSHPRSGDDGSQPWESSWKYFESLLFLKDQFTVRSSGGRLPEVTPEPLYTKDPIANVSDGEMSLVDDSFSPAAPSTSTRQPENKFSAVSSEASGEVSSKRERKFDDILNVLIRLEEEKLEMFKMNEINVPKMVDDDVAFFDSLIPHVKTLLPTDKLLLRIKMLQLVYDFIQAKQAAQCQ